MLLARLLYKSIFRVKRHYLVLWVSAIRSAGWRAQGMKVGKATRIGRLNVTWPHKVHLGSRCSLEEGIYFNASGPYSDGVGIALGNDCFIGTGCEFNISSRLSIGEFCLIGSGSRFIDHDHGMGAGRIKHQEETQSDIVLESDVWVGANCVVLQGVTVGQGAVVGAGSVVTKSVAPFSIVAGVPARLIGERANRSLDRSPSAQQVFQGKG